MTSAPKLRGFGQAGGATSVCSAHPLVIEAAMLQAQAESTFVLLEATCNQVNHDGGYTGLTPAGFRDLVHGVADRIGFPRERIVLGGDHLGPSPWRHLAAETALARAEAMVASYAAAGYEKLHLDASMGCLNEPAVVPDRIAAERAARLAYVAEAAAATSHVRPCYVIGTEVPTPGGAVGEPDFDVTTRQAALATLDMHRCAFAKLGLEDAFERTIALVVQPGVEFGHDRVAVYAPERARCLSAGLAEMPGLVFEAHSTDYQPAESLCELVRDGFAILKVGPALTFAMREALYALDHIATVLDPEPRLSLISVLERTMLAEPDYWRGHYPGDATGQRILRHFSYSDRIRYYWTSSEVRDTVQRLLVHLDEIGIPETLLSQFLPAFSAHALRGEQLTPREIVLASVRRVLREYSEACNAS